MTARESASVATLFIALTLAFAFPLSMRPHRSLPADDPDSHLYMWTLAWDAHAFIHHPLSIFDANIFHPNRDTLAYSENLIGSAIFSAPVLWVTGNPMLAVNFASLLSCVLCGVGAHLLARRLGLSVAASIVAGIVFALSPPRFLRFSQLHMTAVQWIPFSLAYFHAYLDDGKARDLRLAIGFATLQVLASGHGGAFVVVALALLAVYRVALGEPLRLRDRIRDAGIVGALLLLPSVLFLIPYRHAQIDTGLRRTLAGWDTPLESFVASPSPVHVYLQSLFTTRNINYYAGAFLFPGVTPLLLMIAALAPKRRARNGAAPRRDRAVAVRRAAIAALAAWIALDVAVRLLGAGDGLLTTYPNNNTTVQSGYVSIGEAANYTFAVPTTDTIRISIDGAPMFDHAAGDPRWTSRPIPLIRGAHEIRVELQGASARQPAWDWRREDDAGPPRPVPAWLLSRARVTYGRAVAARIARIARLASGVASAIAIVTIAILALVRRRHGWSAWRERHRRNPVPVYLLLTALCVALSLGPPYGLWQFVYWIPGLNFIRASSRFMVLGMLGIAVLAAIGADRLLARFRPTPRLAAAVALASVMIAEFWSGPYTGVPFRLDIPAADRWVARQPGSFVLAEMPVDRLPRYHSTYMLHSMAHWQRMVNGYSGIAPAAHEVLYEQMRTFPDAVSLRELTRFGVTRVVVHLNMFPGEAERRRFEAGVAAFKDSLTLEYSDADARVYAIGPPRD